MNKLEQAQSELDAAIVEQKTAERVVDSKISKVNAARYRLMIAKREAASAIPVDRSARQLTDGGPVTKDHRDINPSTGQQKGYVVLSQDERSKGFVRPVRDTYVHAACGVATHMGSALAETYARDPEFYTGTFCVGCRKHFPLADGSGGYAFKWDDGTGVGE
jgi:hypothetical protein